MPLPRLLLLCLFGMTCAAGAAAQAPAVNPHPAQPIPDTHATPLLQVPALTHIPALIESTSETTQTTQLLRRLQKQLTLAQNDRPCYAMRSYRIKRDNPDSDVTSFAGYSTCQAATEFQAKSAGGLIFPAR